jgi:prepilin peptidase dependent protein D
MISRFAAAIAKHDCIITAKFKLMNIRHNKPINQAFSLIELMAVMIIIIIIASLAISEYRFYINKTKVNGLWEKAEPAKLAIESSYLRTNASVSGITVNSGTAEYTTPTDDFVKCITIQGGVISVVGDPTKFNSSNMWISWTPTVSSGTLTWACTYSSDASQYLSTAASSCSLGTADYSADSACN